MRRKIEVETRKGFGAIEVRYAAAVAKHGTASREAERCRVELRKKLRAEGGWV